MLPPNLLTHFRVQPVNTHSSISWCIQDESRQIHYSGTNISQSRLSMRTRSSPITMGRLHSGGPGDLDSVWGGDQTNPTSWSNQLRGCELAYLDCVRVTQENWSDQLLPRWELISPVLAAPAGLTANLWDVFVFISVYFPVVWHAFSIHCVFKHSSWASLHVSLSEFHKLDFPSM